MTKTLNNPYGICKITPLPLAKQDFKIQWEINCWKKLWWINFSYYANYGNWRIFSLTTSQSPKLIPKEDLKLECTYFNSKFFGEFQSSQENFKNGFSIALKNLAWPMGGSNFVLGQFSHRGAMSVCGSVVLRHRVQFF